MALPTSSIGGSYNNATSANRTSSQSQTFGSAATSASNAAAAAANNQAWGNWESAANFNAIEAQKQREWQERMANTVYQRTIEDMRKAGINPVLAANMGLGTASVSGGSAASIGVPNSYMANAYPDSISSSESVGNSESHGQSWSESGFATFLTSMLGLIDGIAKGVNSSHTINVAINGLQQAGEAAEKTVKDTMYTEEEKKDGTYKNYGNPMLNALGNLMNKFPNGLGEQQGIPFANPTFYDLIPKSNKKG